MTVRPFRVLSLDGGGMRGTYTSAYLASVASAFAHRRRVAAIDVGAAFDLIVGTSTGGIIACALAFGLSPDLLVQFYKQHGSEIFRRRLPRGLTPGLAIDFLVRGRSLKLGAKALEAALHAQFGNATLAEVYARRKIAVAITAVELSQHRSWVFKTPHLHSTTNHRDDATRLVDVCLATSAAPLYRSIALFAGGNEAGAGPRAFVDGGLWANNPVLVGLVDALAMAPSERPIEIFCLGTCPLPAGEHVRKTDVHRGLRGWRFGGNVATLAIDAQEFAFDNIGRLLASSMDRPCRILRFPRDQVPAVLLPYLGLDDVRPEATEALLKQAHTDANMTNSKCADPDSPEGKLISSLFMDAPVADAPQGTG